MDGPRSTEEIKIGDPVSRVIGLTNRRRIHVVGKSLAMRFGGIVYDYGEFADSKMIYASIWPASDHGRIPEMQAWAEGFLAGRFPERNTPTTRIE